MFAEEGRPESVGGDQAQYPHAQDPGGPHEAPGRQGGVLDEAGRRGAVARGDEDDVSHVSGSTRWWRR